MLSQKEFPSAFPSCSAILLPETLPSFFGCSVCVLSCSYGFARPGFSQTPVPSLSPFPASILPRPRFPSSLSPPHPNQLNINYLQSGPHLAGCIYPFPLLVFPSLTLAYASCVSSVCILPPHIPFGRSCGHPAGKLFCRADGGAGRNWGH